MRKIEKKMKTLDELMKQKISKSEDSFGGTAFLSVGMILGMLSVFSIFMVQSQPVKKIAVKESALSQSMDDTGGSSTSAAVEDEDLNHRKTRKN